MAETIIYLDHAATAPLDPEVLEAMLPCLRDGFGNPGSLHRVGRRARKAVAEAREQVAALIGAEAREIVFTSGGTESDNLAIAGTIAHQAGTVITVSTEHHAVLQAARYCADSALPPLVLSVDGQGLIDLSRLEEEIDAGVALVSVMHGNNETGVLQPVDAIAAQCRRVGVPFHSDGVQSAGHEAIDISTWPVDMLTLTAHKLGGPKGVGALFVREATHELISQLVGGGQEGQLRAGTENVAGIVGFGKACQIAREDLVDTNLRLTGLRDRLERGILERIVDVWVNGGDADRLPHISNMGFAGVEGEGILFGLDAEGICVSTGSACTSGLAESSHVLRAMGQSEGKALSAVRFSLGAGNTEADIDRVLNVLPRVVQELRAQ